MNAIQKLSLLCNSRGLQIPFVPNLFLDFRRMALLICFATMVIGKKGSKRISACKYRASMIYIFLGKTW